MGRFGPLAAVSRVRFPRIIRFSVEVDLGPKCRAPQFEFERDRQPKPAPQTHLANPLSSPGGARGFFFS